jgi:thiosulfate reductase cytochrome b subunit
MSGQTLWPDIAFAAWRATHMRRNSRSKVIHPWPLRIMHWLNAAVIIMLIGSGWQIYNASPLFGFTFPPLFTIGRWLGGGIAWHLAFIWLLIGNGALYLAWGTATGHFRRRLWPLSPRLALQEVGAAMRFKLAHEHGVYNAVQRLLYAGVIFTGILIVLSGFAIWKPVQLWPLTDLLGGYVIARYVHFFAMAATTAFLAAHVLLVILVPRVLPPMILGGKMEEDKP